MLLAPQSLENLSDYAGFFGALIAFLPPLRSTVVYLWARRVIKRDIASPGRITPEIKKIAKDAISKAAHFTHLDVTCQFIGFALLVVSFLLKILSK